MIVRNARLRKKPGLVDIAISGGKIESIESCGMIKKDYGKEINADGNLVTPTFVEPFIHLDKVFLAESVRENISGTYSEALEIVRRKKASYTVEMVKEKKQMEERMDRYIRLAVGNGVTIIRSHVDVDTIAELVPLEALLNVKKKYSGIVDLQIVAFPQEGIIKDEGTEELLHKAMEAGAEVVGGVPANEMTDEDSKKHLDIVFDIAKEYDADIDVHVDETDDPSSRTLHYLAVKTIKEGYQGRVTAGHACALTAYDDYYAAKVIQLVKEAEISIKSGPQCEMMLQGKLDKQPIRRGITRVKELIKAGVNVTYGQDITVDPFVPYFGQADPLEIGQVMALAAQLYSKDELEILFDMPTINAARAMRIEDYGVEAGKTASFNVLEAQTVQEAFRKRADRLFVVKSGKVIAENKKIQKLYLT